MKRKELPIGIESFREIRESNSYYVDKTPLIEKLTMGRTTGKKRAQYYFLSRPRRFGKSLLLDTFQYLFEGKKHLFEGLHIYDKWDWSEKHPVVRLNFGKNEYRSREDIEYNVLQQILAIRKKHRLSTITIIISEIFHKIMALFRRKNNSDEVGISNKGAVWLDNVISELHSKTKMRVVVLIDEYDQPFLDVLHDSERAKDHTNYLRGVYGVLKGNQDHLQFVFITGISLFSKVNLFSKINHLNDISIDSEYATICGYTESELKEVFAPELPRYDFELIRRWYDGYSWDLKGEKDKRMFCPHSVLQLFSKKSFDSWWYDECTPQYVYEFMKRKNITSVELSDRRASQSLLKRFNVENPDITSLLYQNGYLTIREAKTTDQKKTTYHLTYPNLEVKQSLSKEYLEHMIGRTLPESLDEDSAHTLKCLTALDTEGFFRSVHQILAGLFYNTYTHLKLTEYEFFYVSMIYAMFAPFDPDDITMEEASSRGRSDMVVKNKMQVFIMEFKCIHSSKEEAQEVATQAMDQIKERGYADKHRKRGVACYGVAMIFGKEERNVLKVVLEELA